jgi:hypothetical protein
MVIRLLIAIMNQVDYASEEAFASANRQLTAALTDKTWIVLLAEGE